MIFPLKLRSTLFKLFAALSLLAAIYHFVGLFYRFDETPFWRHLIFVGINLFCTYGFLKRPKYFIYLFGMLLLQQFYSHGSYLICLWNAKRQIHWLSVIDLIMLPLALICLVEDRKLKLNS